MAIHSGQIKINIDVDKDIPFDIGDFNERMITLQEALAATGRDKLRADFLEFYREEFTND